VTQFGIGAELAQRETRQCSKRIAGRVLRELAPDFAAQIDCRFDRDPAAVEHIRSGLSRSLGVLSGSPRTK
jgi:hypothetical protein